MLVKPTYLKNRHAYLSGCLRYMECMAYGLKFLFVYTINATDSLIVCTVTTFINDKEKSHKLTDHIRITLILVSQPYNKYSQFICIML